MLPRRDPTKRQLLRSNQRRVAPSKGRLNERRTGTFSVVEHFEGLRPRAHPGQYWEIVNKLRGGLQNTRGAGTDSFFGTPDGTPTTTRVGSNTAIKEHWQHLFNMPTSAQDSTMDEVRQRPERAELGDKPDDKEIIRFIRKAKSKKSPGDNNIPAEFWKALVGSDKDLQSE